jgi:hypothetical protein
LQNPSDKLPKLRPLPRSQNPNLRSDFQPAHPSGLFLFPVGSIPRSLSMTVSGAERSAVSGVEGLRLGRSSGGNTAGLELVETAGQALDSLQP